MENLSELRNKYLSNDWQRYPQLPADVFVAGRLHQINGSRLSLIRHQHIIEKDVQGPVDLLKILHVGDIISIDSRNQVTLLAPQMTELPVKNFDWQLLAKWAEYLKLVRLFFEQQGFLELKTPQLVVCPGTEPSLEVFETEYELGSAKRKLFLPTSPELHLKKALSLGAEKIYEIAPVFRNGEKTVIHQPEFTMIEWYRAYDDLGTIQGDVEGLIRFLIQNLNCEGFKNVQVLSIAELFEKYIGFCMKPGTSLDELAVVANKQGLDISHCESIDDIFFLLMTEKIEPHLDPSCLSFVTKYPPYQAALARLDNEGWGERFECYWKGLELCNAFFELNDPQIQRQRFAEDIQKKKILNKKIIPLDDEFLKCLDAGMPPSAGIALGLERLFMALFNVSNISNLKMFPY